MRTMSRRAAGSLHWAVTACVLMAAPAAAQRQGPRRAPGQDRAELEQRVRARMGEVIRRELGLSDEQADRLSAVIQSFEGRRREIATQDLATRRRVEALLLEGGNETEARQLLARMSELQVREADLYREEQAGLLEVLSPMQLLRLQALREQLGQRIRALRGGGQGPGGLRRPGGDPPRGPGGWSER